MMVYVFGIDIPLVELMLVTIAVFIIVLLFSLVFILRVAKKEKDILESTRDLLESEHKIHHNVPKEVKKEGFFAKLFAAPEKPKSASQETKRRNKEIFKKPSKSIFAGWNEFWNARKVEAEKTWQQRYNTEVKQSLQAPIEVQTKQHKQESWWEKHQKEVAKIQESKEKEERLKQQKEDEEKKLAEKAAKNKIVKPFFTMSSEKVIGETWWSRHQKEVAKRAAEEKRKETLAEKQKEKERKEKEMQEEQRKKAEVEHKNPMSGDWLKKRKRELARERAEETRDNEREQRERAEREAEWQKERRNSWWEKHKREVEKRPDPEEQLDKFWKQRKTEAENSWQPKPIEAPPKPHEIEGWWQKHMRRVAEEKARKEEEQKKRLEERRRTAAEARKAEELAKKVKVESWWEKHKRETAAAKVKPSQEKSRESMFAKWHKYWNEQKIAAKSWRKK